MGIKITEDGAVRYINENDVDRTMFPNLAGAMGDEQYDALNGRLTVVEGKVSDLEECCDDVNNDITGLKNEFNESVADLNSALDYTNDVVNNLLAETGYIVDTALEQGSISGTDGEPVNPASSKYVRSKVYIKLITGVTYSVSTNGNTCYIFFYDKDFSYLSNIWGKYQPFTFSLPENAVYAKIMIKHNDNSDISPSAADLITITYTGLLDTLPADVQYGICKQAYIIGGFVVGGFNNGVILNHNYRMIAKSPVYIGNPVTIISDWSKYCIYVWRYDGSTWTGLGWQTANYELSSGYQYQLVVGRTDQTTTELTEAEQAEINSTTYLRPVLWDEIAKAVLPSKYPRLMSRQGEGYGYPDNSLEGIKAALVDGYRNIRVSVAVTSDNVFYATHSNELEHNSTYKRVTINGEAYNEDININEKTSAWIDSIRYSGYPIPTLDSVIAEIVKYDIHEITWEIKGAYTDVQMQALIDKLRYYNLPVVFSGGYLDIDQLTNLDTGLNIAVVFNYTTALGTGFLGRYANKYKTMRYDCYWGDAVPETDVINVIHANNVKLKFGAGTTPSPTALIAAMKWVDICEWPYKISNL